MQSLINASKISRSSKIIRAVNNVGRRQLITLLADHRERNVFTICMALRQDISVVSQHLAILKDAKIVRAHKEGREVFYSLIYGSLERIENFVSKLSNN